jgi:putative ABC transport system permease protein
MLRNLLSFVAWRHVRQKPLRAALTVLGIALGVALFVAISAINASTLGFFRDNVGSITGKATFTVLGSEAGFPEAKVDVVKGVPGVESAVPMIESRVRFEGGPGGKPRSLAVLGIDLLQEAAVRSYKNDDAVVEDPLEFLNQADSIIVTRSFADDNALTNDSPLDLLTAHGKKRFVVRGILSPAGPARAFGGNVAIMDIDGARVTFGKEGKVDRVDVVPAAGQDAGALAARIEAALGPGYRVEQKDQQAETFARMVKGYQGVLSFLSSLALLVGVFLVANAVTLSVGERRREIGVLRALGASRGGVMLLFVVEAAVMGLVGSALGVAGGRGLALALVRRVSESMSRQYVTPIEVSDVRFDGSQMALGIAAGLLAATVAALWPAWRATRIRGAEAFGANGVPEASAGAILRARVARGAGVAMLALLFVSSKLGLGARFPVVESLNPLLAGLGTALAAPWIVTVVLRLLARALRPAGLLGRASVLRLACENLLRNPSRTGSNVLSLMIGLMLVIVMATIHQSFERSIADWQTRTLRSDLIVSSAGRVVSLSVQPLHEDVAAEIDAIPGVDVAGGHGARGFRFVRQMVDGRQIALKAIDPQHPRVGFALLDVTDRPAEEAGRALFARTPAGEPTVIVSENFAAHFGRRTGDVVELDTPAGRTAFRVVGVAVDFANPEGVVYVARDEYKRLYADPLVTAFAVEVTPGASPAAVRDAIDAKLGVRGIVATMNAELRDQLREAMDESFAYTRAIEAAALGVGLLGLLSTLLMSLMERVRELGMLRAIGMSRLQLARMILVEAVLLGVIGGAVAAGLGAYVAHLWVVSSLATSLGWFITVHVPWMAVTTTLLAGLVVGVLAGLVSSRRAARIEIREALEQAS